LRLGRERPHLPKQRVRRGGAREVVRGSETRPV